MVKERVKEGEVPISAANRQETQNKSTDIIHNIQLYSIIKIRIINIKFQKLNYQVSS